MNLHPDFTGQDLEDFLKNNNMSHIYKTVAPEIEIISRRFRKIAKQTDDDQISLSKEIENDFEKHLLNFRIFNISRGMNEIKKQMTGTEDDKEKERLWEEYRALWQERERLINSNF